MSKHILRRTDQGALPETQFSHPLNPRSSVFMRTLGDATGLKRIGVHVMRVPPGHESFAYHAHFTEEELIYVISGRGIAEVGGEKVEIGPGDFLGFPTEPPVAHQLYNPFDQELVYLSCGERHGTEVADFPKQNMRQVRVGMSFSMHAIDEAQPFGPFPLVKAE
jgi:uncharacterized cupin superfamily protein